VELLVVVLEQLHLAAESAGEDKSFHFCGSFTAL
jgi:hypothetical protein